MTASCSTARRKESPPPVTFGVITDVHQDIMHDGPARLGAFVEAMNRAQVGCMVQLGDFCCPYERNREFLATWNQATAAQRLHVLGNHDTDGGFRREQTAEFYGMPARYYAVSLQGIRFVVMDGNDPGGRASGYKRFIAADQLAWLTLELHNGTEPVVVLIHQALDHPQGVENQELVRAVLERARQADGSPRVLAVFCGHHHQDWVHTIGGIHYVQINSASYQWVGEAHAHDSYAAEVLRERPWIRMTCPYRDPLWALVTVDLESGWLTVEGRDSDWVGPSPWAVGLTREAMSPDTTLPAIRSRQLPLKA